MVEWAELYGVNEEKPMGFLEGLTIYQNEDLARIFEGMVYCERCRKPFKEEDLPNTYLGDLCKDCTTKVAGRISNLKSPKRAFCPKDLGEYIFGK